MIKKKLAIFPFNGNGIEALDCFNWEEYDFLGFIDDNIEKTSSAFDVFPRGILNAFPEIYVLAVPGSASSFKTRADLITSLNISRFINAIHPSSSIGKNVQIGYNCLIMAGVVITGNARLNNHIIILPNSVIHHDVIIDSYTIIGSNVVIAGNTTIGQNCYVGSGTNIINNIHIGERSLVGLGSNVINHIPQNSRIAGNPAKELVQFVP